ncbi:MAG: hypothetical protein GEU28_08000 [Dehalococcoidia bacterium]|nr:hypothetical protein [Dehalococcoidia bacterium]
MPTPGPPRPRRVRPAATATGSYPWVVLLCSFSDATTPTPHPASYYASMFNHTRGLRAYWAESSYRKMTIPAPVVRDWKQMPFPVTDYDFPGGGSDTQRLASDCTGLHDADVNFPSVRGIAMFFDGSIGSNYGGGLPIFSSSTA